MDFGTRKNEHTGTCTGICGGSVNHSLIINKIHKREEL